MSFMILSAQHVSVQHANAQHANVKNKEDHSSNDLLYFFGFA